MSLTMLFVPSQIVPTQVVFEGQVPEPPFTVLAPNPLEEESLESERVAAVISIPEDVPVMLEVTVSVAVRVCVPAVKNVAEKLPVPLVSVEFEGRVAWVSDEVKCTVPVYAGVVLPHASVAVIVKLALEPSAEEEGTERTKADVAPGSTVIPD
jgi:hypothetical protein